MDTTKRTSRSKTLAYFLRHAPEKAGLKLDKNGYVAVEELLQALEKNGTPLTRPELEEIVRLDSKGRYQLQDGLIRAVQGHSTQQVDLELAEKAPPGTLFHGTSSGVKAPILEKGLIPGSRHYVHLSVDLATARNVGQRHVRHGERLLVFAVEAQRMAQAGHRFFVAENGVWLVPAVPPEFLKVAQE